VGQQLQLQFNPKPGNFHMPQVESLKNKNKQTKEAEKPWKMLMFHHEFLSSEVYYLQTFIG